MTDQGNKTALSIVIGAALIAAALYFGLSRENPLFPKVNKNQTTALPSPSPSPQPISPSPPITTNQPSPSPTPTPEITWTKSDIVAALSQKTGIPEDKVKFSVSDEIKKSGQILLRGTVSREGEMGGAGFFAVVDQNGVTVTYAGQGVPQCSEVNPYGYPLSWADYCVDENNHTVRRPAP